MIIEYRINGFVKIHEILVQLEPFVRFKRIQLQALKEACELLQLNIRLLSKEHLLRIVDIILVIQNENYTSHSKKSKDELLKILDLTP